MSQLRAQVDKLLTKVSIGYFPQGFISESVLPALPVDQSSGLLGKYNPAEHLRVVHTRAGGRGEARRVEPIKRDVTTTYAIETHALEAVLTPDDYRNVEEPFQAEQDEVIGLTDSIWLEKEVTLSASLLSTGTMTQNTTLTGTSQFNDFVNSDPLTVFLTAQKAVRAGCGVPPDTAIMDWGVAQTLRFHPQLSDRLGIKYNAITALTDAQLAMAMGVRKVIIADPSYNTAVEGQTDSISAIWGKGIILAVLPDAAQLRQVSLGYYLYYRNQKPRTVYRYPINNPANSQGFQVVDAYQFKLTNVNAGYLIAAAIA